MHPDVAFELMITARQHATSDLHEEWAETCQSIANSTPVITLTAPRRP